MDYKSIAAALREILDAVESGALPHDETGLCSLLRERLGVAGGQSLASAQKIFMEQFVPEWPEYSGCPYFPVPCPSGYPQNEGYDEEWAYYYAGGLGRHHWDPRHPYGQARIRMTEFLLEKAEEALAKAGEE